MKNKAKKSVVKSLSEAIESFDITGYDLIAKRTAENNIITSWYNVGDYFHRGFRKAKKINNKELTY